MQSGGIPHIPVANPIDRNRDVAKDFGCVMIMLGYLVLPHSVNILGMYVCYQIAGNKGLVTNQERPHYSWCLETNHGKMKILRWKQAWRIFWKGG